MTVKKLSKRAMLTLFLVSFSFLSACGGGGGNAPQPNPPIPQPPAPDPDPPAPPPPPPPPPPPNFNTTEYRQQYGLGSINAIAAYDDGLTGAGITVAVIDSGFHADFDDVDGNVLTNSTDIIPGRNDLGGGSEHGSIVASVIAGEKNDVDVHGVAFNSKILAIRADSPDACDDDGCGFFDADLARSVNYAVANGADIINLSLSGPAPNSLELKTALDAAAAAGVIIVFAAGNQNNNVPATSTLYALSTGANGQAIIVGATDQQNNLWFSPATPDVDEAGSNKAGPLALGKFVVAPGDGIVFTCGVTFCTGASGTSVAAPHVSGAAALLLEKFPNLSAAEVVEILLTTAADLGEAGIDEVFGNGLIDLAAAIAPVGQMTVTSGNGSTIPVGSGSIQVSAAFGDAFTTSPKATAAFGSVLATDKYDRTYSINLANNMTAIPDSRFDLSTRARSRIYGHHHTVSAPGLGVIELGYTDRWGVLSEAELFPNFNRDSDRRPLNVSFSLHRQLDEKTMMSIHHGAALSEGFTDLDSRNGASLFATDDAFMRFAQDGTGVNVKRLLTPRTQISVIATYSDYQPLERGPKLSRSLGALQLDHLVTDNLNLSLRVGSIHEKGSTLNMVADGGYNVFGGATTVFTTINAAFQTGDWSFGLSASYGSTKTQGDDAAFFSDVSTLHTSAFTLSAKWQTPLPGHFLSFGISQPMRVENGSVMVNLPTARDLTTEAFSYSNSELSLSPSGREIDFEISHLFYSTRGISLATNIAYRLNPGHRADIGGAVEFLSHVQFAF